MAIEAVIFDMDGVLCHLDDLARIGYLSELCGKPHEEIVDAIWTSGFEDRSDRGEFTADEYLAGFGERIGHPLSALEWVAYRKSGMVPIPETLQLVRSCRMKVALLTNNGHMLKRHIADLFPELPSLFGEHLYVSAEFNCQKPLPEIYLRVCQRLEVEPHRAMMVDDRLENVSGAQQAGLKGHHFQKCASLWESLTSR